LDSGEISAEELMSATLDRIDAVNGTINAIVALRDADDLLAQARAVDAQIAKGPRKSVLHGLPMAVKDLQDVAGIRSTSGSTLFADHIPKADHLLPSRLRAAGAIFIGKTNVPEFGLGSNSFNSVYGTTRNPYAHDRTAGGSSGGAGAALATRMVVVADGSDMMGSLRNPAAWNNVYGFRPSYGRVPAQPKTDVYLHQISTDGPMARCPKDIAALLEVIAGPDPRRPHGIVAEPMAGHLDVDIKGRRIGWLGDWGAAFAVEPGILDLGRAGADVFAELGCTVEDVSPPFSAEALWESWTTLRFFANAALLRPLYEDPVKRDFLKPEAIWEIESGLSLSAMQVQRASEIRSDWYAHAAKLFRGYDAMMSPTSQVWPFPIDWRQPEIINNVPMDTYHRWMECVIPVSLIGLPSLNVPVGFNDAGLPMGTQIFGARGNDLGVLQLGQAYHRATDWPNARPPQI
jgi:amidase